MQILLTLQHIRHEGVRPLNPLGAGQWFDCFFCHWSRERARDASLTRCYQEAEEQKNRTAMFLWAMNGDDE